MPVADHEKSRPWFDKPSAKVLIKHISITLPMFGRRAKWCYKNLRPRSPRRLEKAAFCLEDSESGLISVSAGWLNKVWKKWPDDETIQELLAALDDANKR